MAKNDSVITGHQVVLKKVTIEDANQEYLAWLNDPHVTKELETVSNPYTMEMLIAYVKGVLSSSNTQMFIVYDKATSIKIGTGKIHNISEKHGTCNLGLMIGDTNFWGKGYGQEAYRLLINFAFTELHIRKISEAANVTNAASIAMCKKMGFQEEGVLKKQVFSNGEYQDKVILGLFASDWLKR